MKMRKMYKRVSYDSQLCSVQSVSNEKGLAWVKHNIEEVGAFETFLPQLYNERKDKDS